MANENDEVKGPKTKPLRKTSAVPLRKETVRVTLKATPAGASGAPRPPAPAPPKPPSVATTPLETSPIDEEPKEATAAVQGNGSVDLPDVTSAVPLRQETMRVTLKADNSGAPMAPAPTTASAPAQPAPTVPLGANQQYTGMPAPAPTVPLGYVQNIPQPAAPAPTVPLGGGHATVPLATQPLGGTGSSQPLPKATVELQQTQQLTAPLGGPSQMPTLHTEWEEEISRGQGIIKVLAIVAFVAALAALGTQLMHSKHWLEQHYDNDWAQLAETDKPNFKYKKKASEYKNVKK